MTGRAALLAALLGAALAGCGSGSESGLGEALGSLRGFLGPRGAAAPAATATRPDSRQIAATLAATSGEAALVSSEATGLNGVFTEIARNRDTVTLATRNRLSIALSGGIVRATRGLGTDLMSADIEPLRDLVTARREGTATRVMRFLDGEDRERAFTFTCTVTRTGTQGPLTTLAETCKAPFFSFTNTYAVDQNGTVLASRQWVGQKQKYLTIAKLR